MAFAWKAQTCEARRTEHELPLNRMTLVKKLRRLIGCDVPISIRGDGRTLELGERIPSDQLAVYRSCKDRLGVAAVQAIGGFADAAYHHPRPPVGRILRSQLVEPSSSLHPAAGRKA